jgi:1,4-alpha-glucan branching enzyme
MDGGERDALREGRHANPHQVLGAHEATVSGVAGIVVRVYQPAAADCAVVVHGVVTPLRPGGRRLLRGFFPGATMPFRYHLRFIDDDGTTWERGDAYRHWPSLGEMDLYLFREGRTAAVGDAGRAPARDGRRRRGVVRGVGAQRRAA